MAVAVAGPNESVYPALSKALTYVTGVGGQLARWT